MNENKFNLRRLTKWRADSEEMFRAMGLRQGQYAEQLGALADLGTETIIAKNSQFLFQFDDVGAEAMAERTGMSRRTAYYWREDALTMKCNYAMG